MATLYLVATPIGNLQDITLRALETLKSVDVIACEDTRHTKTLLDHYQIEKRLIATHAHNESASSSGIIELLASGLDVAFVSDAGTPAISDPGSLLVNRVREAGFRVVPIPGVSAITTLISVSGCREKSFLFEGFLSPKGGRRRTRLTQLLSYTTPIVLYESPFRILKLLEDLASLAPGIHVVVGREMTKLYEEFIEGSVEEVLETLTKRPSLKGEFALLVGCSDDNS